MSRRTSEANKAIDEAWKKEQGYVSEGQGTRDWTPEQQKDIMEKGKAYDENGKAFEGHHMKSVESHPDYQGKSENIQFLSRDEHKAAHNENFQNATNGYYDPDTGDTKQFKENSLEPCKAEELSNPVAISKSTSTSEEQTEKNSQTQGLDEEMEQDM